MKNTFSWVLLLISFSGLSQKLEEKFLDDDVVFETYKTTYEFFVDEQEDLLKVRQKEEIVLVPRKVVMEFVWPMFFNDQIELVSSELRNQNNRKRNFQKICGPVESNGVFYSDAKLCTYRMQFDTKNQKLKLKSERVYKDARYFSKINLQTFIPGEKRTVEIIKPSWVDLDFVNYNFKDFEIDTSSRKWEEKTIFSYSWDWPGPQSLKAKNEPSYAYFSPHIVPLTKGFKNPKTNRYVNLIAETQDLYDWYKSLVSAVSNDTAKLRGMVDQLTSGKSPEDQLKSIYYWVQDNIKYIAFEDGIMGFQPDDAHAVFEKRYGDCKGMANLLKAMLSIAGYDARLSWLGTNRLPYSYDTPSLAVDNHMICSVFKDDSVIYLDATSKFNELNYCPGHIQGKQILIESGDDYILNTLPVETNSENFEDIVLRAELVNNELETTGNLSMDGDSKQRFLYAYNHLWVETKDRFARSFISENGEPNDFEYELNKMNRDSTVEITFSTKSEHSVNKFGNDIYVQLDVRKELSDMKIDNKRKSHYYFGNRRFLKSKTTFEVPEGYLVSFMPETVSVAHQDFHISLSYSSNGSDVVYEKVIEIKNPILSPEHFDQWNKAIIKLNEFYQNPIILSNES